MQLTLSILKPHVVKNPVAIEHIIRIIQENGLEIVKRAKVHMTKSLAAKFYAEHSGKFFYNRLETSMCRFVCSLIGCHALSHCNKKTFNQYAGYIHSGPIEVMILGGDGAITKWRELLGPTKVFKAVYTHPMSIRSLYGLSDTRNACHGSDSMDSAKREIRIFFDDFDVDQWLDNHPANVNSHTSGSNNDKSVQRGSS